MLPSDIAITRTLCNGILFFLLIFLPLFIADFKRVYQLIKTSQANTNLPVFLYINGKQAEVIGGEGVMIKQPLTERSLDD